MNTIAVLDTVCRVLWPPVAVAAAGGVDAASSMTGLLPLSWPQVPWSALAGLIVAGLAFATLLLPRHRPHAPAEPPPAHSCARHRRRRRRRACSCPSPEFPRCLP